MQTTSVLLLKQHCKMCMHLSLPFLGIICSFFFFCNVHNASLDCIWAKRLKGTVPINFSDSPTNAMHANKISAKNNFEITIYILINSRKIKKITVLMNHNLSLKSWFPYFFTLFTCEEYVQQFYGSSIEKF